jgi:hypothetical protein
MLECQGIEPWLIRKQMYACGGLRSGNYAWAIHTWPESQGVLPLCSEAPGKAGYIARPWLGADALLAIGNPLPASSSSQHSHAALGYKNID